MTSYPFVPPAMRSWAGFRRWGAPQVRHLREGRWWGWGGLPVPAMTCAECMGGDHNLCASERTHHCRVGHGGFAEFVRATSGVGDSLARGGGGGGILEASKAGPLFCGGITVFNPFCYSGDPAHRPHWCQWALGGLGHLGAPVRARRLGLRGHRFSTTAETKSGRAAVNSGAHTTFIWRRRTARSLAAHAGEVSGYDPREQSMCRWTWETLTLASLLGGEGRLHFLLWSGAGGDKRAYSPILGGQKSIQRFSPWEVP